MKRILFINPIDTGSEVETRQDNLGIGYLLASLNEKFGRGTFDFRLVSREVEKNLDEFHPDLVLLTSVTQNYNRAKSYAQLSAQRNIPVIIGGIHISLLPQTMTDDMRIACLGEGERTICDLLEVLLKYNGKYDDNVLRGIPGIAYKSDGALTATPPRPLIKNLDSLPFPAREYLNIGRQAYLFSSRGCPYRCSFCSSSRYWNKVRFHSAEYVLTEIQQLHLNYAPRVISFYDDLFIADKKRLQAIAEGIRSLNLHRKIMFTCSARANLIDHRVAKILKSMNVRSVGLGLESGNEQILYYLKGGSVSVEDNYRATEILSQYGINPNASFVIGSPQETEAQILDTYRFIRRSKVALFDVYVLTPLPGTPVWKEAEASGLVSDDMDWSKLDVNFGQNSEDAIILSQRLQRSDIIRLYRKFMRLRLWRNALKIWRNPFLFQLPGYLWKRFMHKLSIIFQFEARRAKSYSI